MFVTIKHHIRRGVSDLKRSKLRSKLSNRDNSTFLARLQKDRNCRHNLKAERRRNWKRTVQNSVSQQSDLHPTHDEWDWWPVLPEPEVVGTVTCGETETETLALGIEGVGEIGGKGASVSAGSGAQDTQNPAFVHSAEDWRALSWKTEPLQERIP